MKSIQTKLIMLRRRFRDLESAVVAFSGGVDSAVLAKVAHQELGDRMIAVTALSPSVPRIDAESAATFCREHGIPHKNIPTEEFENKRYTANPADRCYFCKEALYDKLIQFAEECCFKAVVEGTNASDLAGHRPGHLASKERRSVSTPLIDCGITKEEVRSISRELKLGKISDKPATACLSSRIPTGTVLEPEILSKVDRAEDMLRSLGLSHVRVRHHGELARIEVGDKEMPLAFERRGEIEECLTKIGYRYITLDLRGYRPATP